MASKNGRTVVAFDGAIETHISTDVDSGNAQRAFTFEVIFYPHLWPAALRTEKPPLHFHPFQEEYIQVLKGQLCVEISGKGRVLTADDGEVCIQPWVHHRLYLSATDLADDNKEPIRFLLSGQKTAEVFQLDTIFFENWYRYQDEMVKGNSVDLIQVMTMFDAGGSYLSLPRWVPFGRTLSMAIGILFGRWIGALFGYQPYYRQWTSDWDLACEKMRQSWFQRHFAVEEEA